MSARKPDITAEFAIRRVELGQDGAVLAERTIDARFSESRLAAINTELKRRGHPAMSQTTSEQVRMLNLESKKARDQSAFPSLRRLLARLGMS